MALRTVVIYAARLLLIRLGSKRFLSQASAFDVIVGIMLGSVMSRAINGSAPLFATRGAGVMLIGLHRLFAVQALRASWFGSIVKGNPVLLIKDGRVEQQGVRRACPNTTSSRRCGYRLREQRWQTSSSSTWS